MTCRTCSALLSSFTFSALPCSHTLYSSSRNLYLAASPSVFQPCLPTFAFCRGLSAATFATSNRLSTDISSIDRSSSKSSPAVVRGCAGSVTVQIIQPRKQLLSRACKLRGSHRQHELLYTVHTLSGIDRSAWKDLDP